jgi:hypothetical protein
MGIVGIFEEDLMVIVSKMNSFCNFIKTGKILTEILVSEIFQKCLKIQK